MNDPHQYTDPVLNMVLKPIDSKDSTQHLSPQHLSQSGVRRQARLHAIQLLYAIEMREIDPARVIAQFWTDAQLNQQILEFGSRLVDNVQLHKQALDGQLIPGLKGWKLHRLPCLVRQILRVAMCELLILREVDIPVIINEAIELTRLFVDEEATRFVNGILDRCRPQ